MIKLNENFIRLLSSLAEKKREIYVKGLLDCFLEQPSELWIEKITNNQEYQRFCISYANDIDIIQDSIELNKRELLLKVQNRFDTIVDNLATKSYDSGGCIEYVSLIIHHNGRSSATFENITLQELEQWLERVIQNQDTIISKISSIKKRFRVFEDGGFIFNLSIGIRHDASLIFMIDSDQFSRPFSIAISNNEQDIIEFIMNYTNITVDNIDDILVFPMGQYDDDDDTSLLV